MFDVATVAIVGKFLPIRCPVHGFEFLEADNIRVVALDGLDVESSSICPDIGKVLDLVIRHGIKEIERHHANVCHGLKLHTLL
jgi:hypothetical protein